MTVNLKRLRALPIAVLVLVAIPLMAPIAANAAMGGANAGTTTLRPDLRSAAVTNISSTGVTTARVCFNKAIASVPNATQFFIGSYRQAERAADSASRASDQRCADVVWSSADVDSKRRTYVRVGGQQNPFGTPAAVANLANGQVNLPDSTPLIGSDTHNGTRGHGVAPNLEGVTINVGASVVNYIFDKDVASADTTAGKFTITNQDGSTTNNVGGAGTVTFSGNVVAVKFPSFVFSTPGNPPVRASIEPFAAVREKTENFGNEGRQTANVPGTGGITNRPDLLSASLAPDGTYVDYLFDEKVVAGPNFVAAYNGGFGVVGSDEIGTSGTNTPGGAGAPTIVNGNTVRVPFTNNTNFYEYEVWATAGPGVVASTTTGAVNPAAGVALGGNAGAFAIGFTTGPEALTATFNTATGVASIRLDQRFQTFDPADIRLVDDAGALIPGTPISVSGAGGPAGQVIANAQFTVGQVTGARSVLLDNTTATGAFRSQASLFSYPNVSQIVSPTAPAHFTRRNGKIRWTKATGTRLVKRSFRRVK